MKKGIQTFLFLLMYFITDAQTICKKTSVYFDLDKSELSKAANSKIDSLLNTLNGNSYFIELYGYTDSSATTDYNLELSKKRIISVRTKISLNPTIKFKFQEKNLGESESTLDLAHDRRVDIFVFPENNGKIVLANMNEIVEIPIDYFGPCGVCNSNPEIKAYYNDTDAREANIVFQTSAGEDLITAGTVNFDFVPCDPTQKNPLDTITFKIKADNIDTEMTVWEPDTINGIIYWKTSEIKPIFDTINKEYIIASNQRLFNLDKPVPRYKHVISKIAFPKEFTTIKSYLTPPSITPSLPTLGDTLVFRKTDSTYNLISIGQLNDQTYLFNKDLDSILFPSGTTLRTFYAGKIYIVTFDNYTLLTYNDTILKVKFKKSSKPEQFGFYLEEFNEFIPINKGLNSKYFDSKKPNVNYSLAMIKNDKLYVLTNRNVKTNFNKKNKIYKINFNSSNIKYFKHNKSYTVSAK